MGCADPSSCVNALHWMCLCIVCFLFSALALQTNFPWEHEQMSSYCYSYNNITCAAAHSEDFMLPRCIWVFWQGAKAKSTIKGAGF